MHSAPSDKEESLREDESNEAIDDDCVVTFSSVEVEKKRKRKRKEEGSAEVSPKESEGEEETKQNNVKHKQQTEKVIVWMSLRKTAKTTLESLAVTVESLLLLLQH